jgi:hypothetical protein
VLLTDRSHIPRKLLKESGRKMNKHEVEDC